MPPRRQGTSGDPRSQRSPLRDMPSHARSYKRAALSALATLLACVGVAVATSQPQAHAATIPGLQQQISAGQGNVSSLSGTYNAASGHLSQIDSAIASLEQRLSR